MLHTNCHFIKLYFLCLEDKAISQYETEGLDEEEWLETLWHI